MVTKTAKGVFGAWCVVSRAWRVISDGLVFDGSPWLRVFAERIGLPSGRELSPFYRVEKHPFAGVFAVAEDGRIILLRRYRHGARRVTLDVAAGLIDGDESPLEAAQRELLEETGYEARSWTSMGSFAQDGNSGVSVAHLFHAEGARRVDEPRPDDTEEAEVVLLHPEEARAALDAGEFATLGGLSTVACGLLRLRG